MESSKRSSRVAQLIYLMDPHCGWCFGFSNTFREIAAYYQSNELLDISLVTGGLFHPPIVTSLEFADDKRPIADRISKRFGVRFSEDYFTNVIGSGKLDSLPPCLAINAVKIHKPGAEIDFASKLINAAFTQGRNISDHSVCMEVVVEMGTGGHSTTTS